MVPADRQDHDQRPRRLVRALPGTGDRIFMGLRRSSALVVLLVFTAIGLFLGIQAFQAIKVAKFSFLTTAAWEPDIHHFGIAGIMADTIFIALVAVIIAIPISLGLSLFISEIAPQKIKRALVSLVDLMAAIPSVVYGLWGIFVVIPLVRPYADWLYGHLGWIPFFGTPLSGPGLLPASIVLAIMVLPTISAISRDALVAVPPKMREAAFGMGATRWEAILAIFVPTAATGIFGAVILGFGRALGETMALAMLAGNANVISWSLFSPANTLAALLANHFPEADGIEVGALMYAALVLLGITLVVNVVGTLILQRADANLKGLR
jgi:phosphate transport system permease protein